MLRHLWSNLNACCMTLVETNLNPSLLTNKDSLYMTVVKNKPDASMISNDKKKLMGKIQKGRVVIGVKG